MPHGNGLSAACQRQPMTGAMRGLNGFTAIGGGRSIAPEDPGGTKMRNSRPAGFTLLELMIVVAVIGILAILAMPSFIEQIRKGKRAEAIQAIGDLQLRQERWRADRPSYGNTTGANEAAGNLFGSVAAVNTYNGTLKYYNISAINNTGTGYTLTATRKGDLANDPRCGNFTLTMAAGTATKGVSAGDVNYCWRQ
jgi:type IV pilus assembly protein PilE